MVSAVFMTIIKNNNAKNIFYVTLLEFHFFIGSTINNIL